MKINQYLRLAAGIMVFLGLILQKFHPVAGTILLGFVSVNLIQSSLTNWCPLITILKKLHVSE